MIVIYLSIAFELRMAIAAFVALVHDLVIATGIYALAGFQVSPATVIGLLTILGYSLYDTVVVFDKVRENTAGLLGGARTTYSQAANLALNQTLVRSINTSMIALLPVAGDPGRGDRPARRQQRARGTRARPVRRHAVRHLLLDLHRDPGAGRPEGAPAAVPGAGQAGGGARLRRPGGQAGRGEGGGGGPHPVPARAAAELSPAQLAEEEPDDVGFADEVDDGAGPTADELTATASRAPGAPASRGAPGTARPGPRQQPRRSGGSASRHRPAGKKKRR